MTTYEHSLYEQVSATSSGRDPLNASSSSMIDQVEQSMLTYTYFNAIFLALGCVEFLLLVIFFTFLTQSGLLALSLALLFLTFFSYFILRLYFQAQKSESFQKATYDYIDHCKASIRYQDTKPQMHIVLANYCTSMAHSLKERELYHYPIPPFLMRFESFLKTFSRWWRWQDLYRIREMLLLTAVQENIKLVKCEPMSLKVHASLANAYVTLSTLYQIPDCEQGETWKNWVFDKSFQKRLSKQFKQAVELAIEEFKIIKEFAPNDPWIHTQLAYSYRDLKMPLDEIREYESILNLLPDNLETRYKLATLYFEQGWNAQGLRIYSQLKQENDPKSEEIIKYYGIKSLSSVMDHELK